MIITLADSCIGKADRLRLESFAAHLIAHGCAARWDWNERGPDVALQVYKGRGDARPMIDFKLSRANRAFCARDSAGRVIAEGALPHVLTVVDRLARSDDGCSRA